MIEINFRKAEPSDLPKIIALLADDPLGKSRETFTDPILPCYTEAFTKIQNDPNQALMVILQKEEIIATFQLTLLHYLNRMGSSRVLLESVHVKESARNKGVGNQIIQWSVSWAKAQGANILQLTSDKQRPDAIRFYERHGFVASHEGFKLHLA